MEIRVLNNLYTDENTYFIIEKDKAVVIDPGTDFDKIKEFSKDLKIEYIFLTHCHYDHIMSVNMLLEDTKAKTGMTKECSENVKNTDISLTKLGLQREEIIKKADIIFDDGDIFDFYGNKIKIIKTPGHTNCSCCYLLEDNLFSGDTLFWQNVGRWDLPTGDGEKLINSIKNKIYSLPDETIVYSGHGKNTKIGYEKKYNFYVNSN